MVLEARAFCYLSGYRHGGGGFSHEKWASESIWHQGNWRCAVASGSRLVRLSGCVQLTPGEGAGREEFNRREGCGCFRGQWR